MPWEVIKIKHYVCIIYKICLFSEKGKGKAVASGKKAKTVHGM